MDTYQPTITKPWNWLSLMFSAFYFFSLFYSELTFSFIFSSLVFYGAFALVYWALLVARSRYRAALIVVCIGLGILASKFNPSASMFFGYACFFSGFYLRKSIALGLCSASIAGIFVSAFLFNLWTPFYIFPGLIPALVLGFMGAFIQQAERHQWQSLKNEQEKQLLVKTAERERIARDLHDTLGHTLTCITLKSALAKKLGAAGQMEQALSEIAEVEMISRATLANVREVISGYRQSNLMQTLATLRQRLEEGGYLVELEGVSKLAHELRPAVELAVIMMLTEAVTNILRHSNGDAVSMYVQRRGASLKITVHDNGNVSSLNPGNGLKGIEERLVALEGTLTTECSQGTQLTITLPDAFYETASG